VQRGVGGFVYRTSLGRLAVDLSRASAKYLFRQGKEFSELGMHFIQVVRKNGRARVRVAASRRA